MRHLLSVVLTVWSTLALVSAQTKVTMTFASQNKNPAFDAAVNEYRQIWFRSSYPPEEKKGTLVHELGHRMNEQLEKRPQDLDEHRLLFLYLYDLYVDLYGKEFADREVAFGKTLKGLYDYEGAWNWALAMNREQRLSRFADVVKTNRK